MKTLLLIDANSLIHRSFHALPPLTTPDGKPIQAIYGLASIFLKLWREEKPDYAAACFDRPEPTFRKEKYKEYKAQRPKAPSELISQIIEAHNFFKEFGIKTFEKAGYEADDLIATLAEKFRKTKNLKVVILTGDLDTLQLVESDAVAVRTFKKGISETHLYNERAVYERYGLRPDQLVDYKALIGDPSDNIRGIPGVGPKTASALLKKYDTIENAFRNIKKDPKASEKIGAFRDQAEFSKSLVILERQAPIGVRNIEECGVANGPARAIPYFRALGFESLIRRVRGESRPEARREAEAPLRRVQSSMFEGGKLAPHIPGNDVLFVAGPPETKQEEKEFVSQKPKVGFALKALLKALWARGRDLRPPYFDLGVAFWLLDPDFKQYDPARASRKFLRKEWKGTRSDFALALDFTRRTLEAHHLEGVFHEMEMPLLRILAEMEEAGVLLNQRKLAELEAEIGAYLAERAAKIYEAVGEEFNLNSPKQIAAVLERIAPESRAARKTPGGKPSTRADVLQGLGNAHPAIRLLLEYREAFKIQSTYVRPFQALGRADGRLHTTFIQTGTATGRLSSQSPNLQNIPKDSAWADKLRGVIESPKGSTLLSCDYSQIELRILAALSGDEKMIEAFRGGLDIHRTTASKVFGVPYGAVTPQMRRLAKTLNFGLIYGMGATAFGRASGLSREEAAGFIRAYFEEFANIRNWQEKIKEDARTFGYVETRAGRRRYLPNIVSGSPRYAAEAERAAVNHPVQGFAADLMKRAVIKVKEALEERKWWGRDVRLLLSIHDELLFEVREGMMKETSALMKEIMEAAHPLRVPLKVDVSAGKNWGALEPLDIT